MEVTKFIGLICFTWLFTVGAAPVQFVKRLFEVSNKCEPKAVYKQVTQKLINCSMCMGFWIGLIFYQDIWMACIISLTAEAFCRVTAKLGNTFDGL